MNSRLFCALRRRGCLNLLPDPLYLRLAFKSIMGKKLNLNHPKTFNEKIQWLKLNDRNPRYSQYVDKYRVREYISSVLGEKYLIPLIGKWESADEIDFSKLPNQFVLKCNHNSGVGLYVCKDKSVIDIESVKKELKRGLTENYYLSGREWPYKEIDRCIIAEKYMTDSSTEDCFTDYKFYCFNGYVDCVMVCIDRNINDPKFYFFDREWNLKRYNVRGKNAPSNFSLQKPGCIDEMFKIATKLSKGIPFVRVDLYQSDNQVFFGEMTFYPDSGFDPNYLDETDKYFGDLIDLSISYKKINTNGLSK